MNLDDESYLSAYLDDELDPADRLAIEWSVESSPPLGEQLRALALARDAIASLDRPSLPRDLAPILKARLVSDRRKARIQALARPARAVLTVSAFSAFAASLIFALILLNHPLHPTDPPIVADQPKREPSPLPHPSEPSVPTPTPALAPKPSELAIQQDPPSPRILTPPADEAKELRDRRSATRMFERRHLPRVVIVTDVIEAPDRVKELIDQDARKNPDYGRISICQDIVLDPDHAEAAEVFAIPMEESGRRSFVDRLREKFPDLVEEGDSRFELVSQLPEVGQVAIFRGTEAAPLVPPPADVRTYIANRTDATTDHFVRSPGSVDSPRSGSVEGSTVEKPEGSNPVGTAELASNDPEAGPDFVGPPNPYRSPPPKPGDEITLIVWVTRPSRR